MAEVDILLASYNGEKYIAEQLDSLLAQTFKDIRIIIRDDGSTDRTPEIIEEYAGKYPGIIEVVHDDVVCKNAGKNFFQLMKYAKAEYIMLSDQDDYWLPYKVQITLDYMKNTERENPGKPVLVFCGVNVVDENLKETGILCHIPLDKINYSTKGLLWGCCTMGCTQMLNRAAYKDFGDFSEQMDMHDYWTGLYVSICGVMRYIPMPLMLYRQHSNNVFGYKQQSFAKHIWLIVSSPFKKLRLSREKFYFKRDMAELLLKMYEHKMTPEKKQEINDFLGLFSKNRISRFMSLRKAPPVTERKFFTFYDWLDSKFSTFLFIMKLLLY